MYINLEFLDGSLNYFTLHINLYTSIYIRTYVLQEFIHPQR